MGITKNKPRVIIGNSHAALSALESMHKVDPQSTTIILTKEEEMPYSPTSLVRFIAGEVKEESLGLRSRSFYDRVNATVFPRHEVEYLDNKNREITFTNGSKLGYDKVLVATGSIPVVPPFEGLRKEEAITLRRLEDARKIIRLCESSKKAVILGAGLIAMEVAMALRKRGLDVTIIARRRILRVYVDVDGGSIIKDVYRQQGIEVMEESPIPGIESGTKGVRVSLQSGDKVDADFVLVATGVKPNVEFMVNSGIEIADGVLADERMQTNDPFVYVAGDIAQGKGFFGEDKVVTPTMLNAVSQGKVAGSNMAGGAEVSAGSLPANIYNFFGNVVFSIGLSLAEGGGEGLKVLKAIDEPNRSLKKLVISDGKLVGCTMINQPVEAGLCREMIMKGWETDDVVEHFDNDLASAFRRTLIKNNSKEMKLQRENESL